MITIETDRLILRPFRESDLDDYHAIVSDPDVMRYIGDGSTMDRATAWRSIAMLLGHWQIRGFGLWAATIKETGELIGRIGLFQPEGWPGLEVGWLLGKRWQRQGYATEGARASLAHAFQTLAAESVLSIIQVENQPSIRVAERVGERLHERTVFQNKEVLLYAITRNEFRAFRDHASGTEAAGPIDGAT